jgi:hypothetical protein
MRRASEASIETTSRPALIALVAGIATLTVGTAFGWNSGIVDAIVQPPPLIRAALVGVSVVAALALLAAALRMLRGEGQTNRGTAVAGADLVVMVRGIRLSFLALAAAAAAAGWVLGHPLPLVVALVIAAVDVIETSILLLVVTIRTRRD